MVEVSAPPGVAATAAAVQPSDDVIVPILYVTTDRVELVEQLDVVNRFPEQINELSEYFTWSTGGLQLKLAEPVVVFSDKSAAQLWCGDSRPLLVNCRHFFGAAKDDIAAKTDLPDGAVQWVFAWGGSALAGGPDRFAMTGEAASVAFYDGGDTCDNYLPAFIHDDAPGFLCAFPGSGTRRGNNAANLHELGHAAWGLVHPDQVEGIPFLLADTSIMQNHQRFQAAGWLDSEVAQIEAGGYTTGQSKPSANIPIAAASRVGDSDTVRVTVSGSLTSSTTRFRVFDSHHLAELRLLGEFTGQTGLVTMPVNTCFWVAVWDADHRPTQNLREAAQGCVGGTSRGECLHRVPTINYAAAPGPVEILGTPGDDVILGSRFDDVIGGLAGDDLICGRDGNDAIWGQTGRDRLDGGAGDDRLRGGGDNDVLEGSAGSDDLHGGARNDLVMGGSGADTFVRGGTGDDYVDGGAGDDLLVNGNGGFDMVFGGSGNDRLVAGGPRPDFVSGGEGDDRVKGNTGADYLLGGPGDDELFGGRQSDSLDGGEGFNFCNGGLEVDIILGGCAELVLAPRVLSRAADPSGSFDAAAETAWMKRQAAAQFASSTN